MTFNFLCAWLVTATVWAQPVVIPLEKAPPTLKREKPVVTAAILDARPSFEYAMAHPRGAGHIRVEDYNQTEAPHLGALDPDFNLLASKLRALGVHPDRTITVVGRGKDGRGEEGRVAWMLKFLGVSKVKIINIQEVKKKTSGQKENIETAPIWKPEVKSSLRITTKELQALLTQKRADYVLIDVRSRDEYDGKGEDAVARMGRLPGAINIPWTEFVSAQGVPVNKDEARHLLTSRGADLSKRLIFYCASGLRAAYATNAALEADLDATNYDGGLKEWVGIRDTNQNQNNRNTSNH
ncbi:MAG: hypothetical protein IT289_12080 [Oligoflexia bacterium]|nr:hypothetical protein [Oligoflexia bacterium]